MLLFVQVRAGSLSQVDGDTRPQRTTQLSLGKEHVTAVLTPIALMPPCLKTLLASLVLAVHVSKHSELEHNKYVNVENVTCPFEPGSEAAVEERLLCTDHSSGL